jgi:hypothetical protein
MPTIASRHHQQKGIRVLYERYHKFIVVVLKLLRPAASAPMAPIFQFTQRHTYVLVEVLFDGFAPISRRRNFSGMFRT